VAEETKTTESQPDGTAGKQAETPPTQTGGGDAAKLAVLEEKLKASEQRADSLEGKLKHALRLVKTDGVSDEEVIESVSVVMQEAGFSARQISDYIKQLTEEEDEGEAPAKGKKGADDGWRDEMEKSLRQLTASENQRTFAELNRSLREQVEQALDGSKELVTLVEKLAELSADDDGKVEEQKRTIAGTIKDEISEVTKARLAVRRAQAGNKWDPSWIGTEAKAAAAEVQKRYASKGIRTDVIGRVLNADPGTTVQDRKPVKVPEYDKGTSVADTSANLREWMADVLVRGRDSQPRGRSKV
jgi:DNA-binding transcriptional MerR regulator